MSGHPVAVAAGRLVPSTRYRHPGDVIRLIGRSGVLFALAGTALGAAGAFALTRFLSGMLFGVSSLDPLTFAVVPAPGQQSRRKTVC